MSFPSGTNKKNLKIKNISFMSPITRTKINISNLIAETQRIITNSNSNKISQFQNSEINSPKVDINFNKDNQFISDLYRSFSPKGPNIASPQNESNNIIKKGVSNKKNNIKIKKANKLLLILLLSEFAFDIAEIFSLPAKSTKINLPKIT